MKFINTEIRDLVIVQPQVFEDSRGYFYECYHEGKFENAGLKYKFVQDNQSKSSFGVLRGLHYQLEPHSQTKLVRVLEGSILDVVVDIRKGSPTFGKSFAIELSAENKLQLLVPKGFAHGFGVLSPIAVVHYKCDNLYNPQWERGILFNDPVLKIEWKIPESQMILSTKDKIYPLLKDAEINFIY